MCCCLVVAWCLTPSCGFQIFTLPGVVQLLLRTLDPALGRAASFSRSKLVQHTAANLLAAAFRVRSVAVLRGVLTHCGWDWFAMQDERVWPVSFVVAFIRDAASLRTWVDSPQCQLFRDNVLTAFITTSAASNGANPSDCAGTGAGAGAGAGAGGELLVHGLCCTSRSLPSLRWVVRRLI